MGPGRLKTKDDRCEAHCATEWQKAAERQKHMTAFGFGEAGSIHCCRHCGELRLAQVTSLTQSPKQQADHALQLAGIVGEAFEQAVDRNT